MFTKIQVDYELVDGLHTFTSREDLGRGLFVMTRNLEAAFDEVSYQLATLLEFNHKIIVDDLYCSTNFAYFNAYLKAQHNNIVTCPLMWEFKYNGS